jgi:hypothetical protein
MVARFRLASVPVGGRPSISTNANGASLPIVLSLIGSGAMAQRNVFGAGANLSSTLSLVSGVASAQL